MLLMFLVTLTNIYARQALSISLKMAVKKLFALQIELGQSCLQDVKVSAMFGKHDISPNNRMIYAHDCP